MEAERKEGKKQSCQFISRKGDQCTSKVTFITAEGLMFCNSHTKSTMKVKCTFPRCPYWTAAKRGMCSGHGYKIPSPEDIEIITTVPAGESQCDMNSIRGERCENKAISGYTRCTKHVGTPNRAKCLFPTCKAFTNGKYGTCSKHTNISNVWAIGKVISELYFTEGSEPYIRAVLKYNNDRAHLQNSHEDIVKQVHKHIKKLRPDVDLSTVVVPSLDEDDSDDSEAANSPGESGRPSPIDPVIEIDASVIIPVSNPPLVDYVN